MMWNYIVRIPWIQKSMCCVYFEHYDRYHEHSLVIDVEFKSIRFLLRVWYYGFAWTVYKRTRNIEPTVWYTLISTDIKRLSYAYNKGFTVCHQHEVLEQYLA